jgi:hypothetical protein
VCEFLLFSFPKNPVKKMVKSRVSSYVNAPLLSGGPEVETNVTWCKARKGRLGGKKEDARNEDEDEVEEGQERETRTGTFGSEILDLERKKIRVTITLRYESQVWDLGVGKVR